MRSRPHLVFLPHWLLAAALLRLGRSPRRSWILLSTAGHFFATTGPPSPARNAPSPTLSARDPSPPLSPLLMTASPTREQSALSPVLPDSSIHLPAREPSPPLTADASVDQEPQSSTPRSAGSRGRQYSFVFHSPRAYSQSTLFRRPTPQAWLVRFLCLLLPPLLLFPWWQPLLPTAPSSLLPGPLSPLLLLLVSTSCLYLLSRGVFTILSCRRPGRPQSRRSPILPSTRTLSNLPRHSSHRRPGSAPSRGR